MLCPPRVVHPQLAVLEERSGGIQVRVIKNDGLRENSIVLTRIKCLFQSELPAMPKEYITRLVFDCAHSSLAIVKLPSLQVLGAITYREFVPRRFAEIAFCAVASDQHAKGYGGHLMAHLKDYIRSTTPIMHLLTYADNRALGYFQKQGFTRDISLDRSVWVGYVKDYVGATMMQCSMIPRIRYLEASRMLRKQKETVQAKISEGSKGNDVVHAPPKQWANGHVAPIDPLSIPAIRATGWSPEMDALAREPRFGPHIRAMRRFLYQLQAHHDAWPFLVPVNSDEVPDYYDLIKTPMDLSTVEARLNDNHYAGPEDIVFDIQLVFSNCRYYNRASSVYCKCAKKLETYMWKIVDENVEWSALVSRGIHQTNGVSSPVF